MLTPEREAELYSEFERLENGKRQRLNYLMSAVLLWNLIFVNFLILSKANVIIPEQHPSISNNQVLLMQMNFGFFGLFVFIMVFHIENDFMQALNYFVFYLLYLVIIIPIISIPSEIYIPMWLLGVGVYFTLGILMNSLPFVLYPNESRWLALKRQYLPRPPQQQQQQRPLIVSLSEQKSTIMGSGNASSTLNAKEKTH